MNQVMHLLSDTRNILTEQSNINNKSIIKLHMKATAHINLAIRTEYQVDLEDDAEKILVNPYTHLCLRFVDIERVCCTR